MATDLGGPTPTSSRRANGAARDTAPPATRSPRPGWRDPRLWLGILVVAGCVVAGARIVDAADDTVAVWAVARDVGVGETLQPDDLVATRVHFADRGTGSGYFTVAQELPADLRLSRGLAAGELLPRTAVGSAESDDTVEVPVAVEDGQVPASVTAGSVVDVYLLAGAGRGGPSAGRQGAGSGDGPGGGSGVGPGVGPVLAAVTVVDAPPAADGFSASGKRQLVLAVSERDARRFFAALGATEDPLLTVVRRS